LRYIHAALWANGAWTVKRKAVAPVDLKAIDLIYNSINIEADDDDF